MSRPSLLLRRSTSFGGARRRPCCSSPHRCSSARRRRPCLARLREAGRGLCGRVRALVAVIRRVDFILHPRAPSARCWLAMEDNGALGSVRLYLMAPSTSVPRTARSTRSMRRCGKTEWAASAAHSRAIATARPGVASSRPPLLWTLLRTHLCVYVASTPDAGERIDVSAATRATEVII